MPGPGDASHLPNLRPGRRPPDPAEHLPRQRRGVTPQMIGRYPDYDVLAPEVTRTWDGKTRETVMARLEVGGGLRFFTPQEEPAVRAFTDTVTAQDREPRIPVVEMLDRKYAEGKLDGYQYAGMPDDRDTWHLVLAGLDETARARFGRRFHEIDQEAREAICEGMSAGTLAGGAWDRLNVKRAWSVCMRGVLSEFYSHPWSWNEIGFGGPAYPRGYARMGEIGIREPFEKPDRIGMDPVRDAEARGLP